MGNPTTTITPTGQRRTGTARDALITAAKELLPDRAPSTITGRDLAAAAGVNYGLVHHHFGGKDAALVAGLRALRDDFTSTHGNAASMPLLTSSDPYLKALIRSNVDYPDTVQLGTEFPIGAELVAALEARMNTTDDDGLIEAKARAIAMISIQLCSAVFGPVLLGATGVEQHQRADVQNALAGLYDSLALTDSTPRSITSR